jgi:hypothetical protein
MGYYKCIRCGGGDVYTSDENGRTFALTLDTPSAVDPTMFQTAKQTVTRCKACGEKSKFIYTKDDNEYVKARSAKLLRWILSGSLILIVAPTVLSYFLGL